MKTLITLSLAALLTAGTFIAYAQSGDANDPLARLMRQRAEEEKQLGGQSSAPTDASPATPASTAPASPDQATPAPTPAVTMEAPVIEGGSTNGIHLNFRNAPLDTVLNYLSAAAGFHIVLESSVSGTVSVISSQPLTKDEAVDLLNSVLNKNGLALIRDGNILTVLRQSDAVGRNIPVKVWNNDVNSIPNNDEIVTQIIPIRFVEARQLLTDISPFNTAQRIVANEAGNSIIVTDTQANIRHLAEIIKAIDSSAEGETEIRVFTLKYANPSDVATLLGSVFPSQNGGAQNPIRFGGGGPGGFRGGGGNPFAAFLAGQSGTASSSQNRIQKQTQVIAVADARTQSVVVTASKDLMDQIAEMMDKLDVPSSRDQDVYTVNVATGDPQQILQVLQSTFPANATSRNSSTTSQSQNSALQQRQQYNANQQGTSSSSTGLGTTTGGSRSGSLP